MCTIKSIGFDHKMTFNSLISNSRIDKFCIRPSPFFLIRIPFTEAFATWITNEYFEHFENANVFMCISINMIPLAFDASMTLKIAMVYKLFRSLWMCVCVCTTLWCVESFEIRYTVYHWIDDRISIGFQFAYALCVCCSFHVGILIKCLSLGLEWWWMVNTREKKKFMFK